jgi:hypothetical protein
MTLNQFIKLYKYNLNTDFGKLRLIISAHTNYLFKNFKKLPFANEGRAVYIKNIGLKGVFNY